MLAKHRAPQWLMVSLLLGSLATALPAQEKPAEDEALRVGEGVSRPEKISGAPPVYTEMARKAGVNGTVILESIIDEQGDVTNVRVLQGLPMGLDQAAVEAVRTWKFKPAMFEGRPVKVYYTLTVNFKVEKPSGFGPVFRGFLAKNPDFTEHLNAKRYTEASALLDRWSVERPGDSELPLARIYLLLEQGRLDDAWKLALPLRGPGSFEALHRVGLVALQRAQRDKILNAEARGRIIDLGLQAETLAMDAEPDEPEPPLIKSLLLREKARLTTDPEERQDFLEEARQLESLVVEMLKTRKLPPGAEKPQG
jgi:TonB family protein